MSEASKNNNVISIHDGHKKRLREKFLVNNDFTGFSEHEILEFLLNYGNVRKNTNIIAHQLLNKFESIYGVINASKEQLMSIDGVGECMASLIMMQRSLFGIYSQEMHDIKKLTPEDNNFIPYICSLFADANVEKAYMICLNGIGKITNTSMISRGLDDSVLVDRKRLIVDAINNNAKSVIFAHNHPGGIAKPSYEDIESTKKLHDILSSFGIALTDHFVVAENKCISIMNDSRYKYL